MLIKWQFLTIQNNKNISHYDFIFLTNNNQSVSLWEKGLSIILFFYAQTNNCMRKGQNIKMSQIESVFLNQVFK